MPTLERPGARVYYTVDGAAHDRERAVLYIPGFGSHSGDVLSTRLRAGIGQRRRVFAVDNRGSGQTQITDSAPVTLETYADDLAAVLDAEAVERAHIFGYSMGGCIAMTFALRHPQRVRSLTAAVSFAYMPLPSRAGWIIQTTRLLRDHGVPDELINRVSAVHLLPEELFHFAPVLDAWIAAPADPWQQTRAGYELQSGALRDYDLRPHLSAIGAPTLVISAADDLLVPPHYQDAIAAGIPGARLARYRGGHIFMALPDPVLELLEPGASRYLDDLFAFWAAHD
ncbi:MAG: alpha/beta fold hydrolase [Candidatus Flexifilum sp.]